VLIVGGSRGMSGAVALAGLGALRGGAGLVYLAVPQGIAATVASIEPSYLTIPLPDEHHGRISREAQLPLSQALEGSTAAGIGPGLGRSDELLELVRWLYTTVEQPMVVDADALNALSQISDVLSQQKAPRVLTPHPGEFAQLVGSDVASVQKNREKMAADFASQHAVVLVLKGYRTVITDGRRIAINKTGNSGMATGGTGDVLTGLLTALLAQRMEPFEAAQLAVHLHGLAGDLAAEELSQPGLIASDLPRYLGAAWKKYTTRAKK
jgi:NAD(P)H-hydrate epimerase